MFCSWSTQSANKAIQAAARKAQRQPFTVYQIRHSFATWLRHAGADLAVIQDLYGHTDAATTGIYASPTLAKQRDAIQRLRLVTHGCVRNPFPILRLRLPMPRRASIPTTRYAHPSRCYFGSLMSAFRTEGNLTSPPAVSRIAFLHDAANFSLGSSANTLATSKQTVRTHHGCSVSLGGTHTLCREMRLRPIRRQPQAVRVPEQDSLCWFRYFITRQILKNIDLELSHFVDAYRSVVPSLRLADTSPFTAFQHNIEFRISASVIARNKSHESHSFQDSRF